MRPPRRLQLWALMLCVALLGSMAHARSANKAVRPRHSSPARHVALARVHQRKHTDKIPAKKNRGRPGQQRMHQERVREIQAALIRENYLQGRADGVWDHRSKSAMARFQSDNRWQTRVVPDSRALIKLGLGPDYAGLINADTAAISLIAGGGTRFSASSSQR